MVRRINPSRRSRLAGRKGKGFQINPFTKRFRERSHRRLDN
jgi:hypothetical protein